MRSKVFCSFLCFFLCFSLFSLEVSASGRDVNDASLRVYSPSGALDIYPTVSSVPHISSSAPGTSFYSNFFHYAFSGIAMFQFASKQDSVLTGNYSFSSQVKVDLQLDLASVPDSYSNHVVNVHFPESSDLTFIYAGSPSFVFDSSGHCSFTFTVFGNTFLRGGYFSIPISYDVSCVYVTSSPVSKAPGRGKLDVTYTASFNGSLVWVSASSSVQSSVDAVNDTLKNQHQQDINSANGTANNATSSSQALQGTLSAWEIFTMPFTLLRQFLGILSAPGNASLTFPSFSLMGYKIWDSYTFDLNVIKTSFPLLYNGLHAVSGILVVTAFVRYCIGKWNAIIGDTSR